MTNENKLTLPTVPDGFTPWGGGEQPAETRGKRVHFLLRDGEDDILPADSLRWDHVHGERRNDILAYKLADERPAPASPTSAQPEHSHAQVLRWIADGLVVQFRNGAGAWRDQPADTTLREISYCIYPPDRYRPAPPKPRMIVVNGIEVQAGETSAPAYGTQCFIPSPAHPDWVAAFAWDEDREQYRMRLNRGLVYLDRATCEQRSKAMVATQEAA
ncbi:hypothetical protein [Acidovorax phage ACPWH]|nr:hypothetical protein [Acidovorax phage ACPWH]